ncbi:MAG: ECF-type sigma factor [Planctomycetota bacterium]
MDDERRATSELLLRACAGDATATGQLSPLLYDELRRIARNLLRHERPSHTLQPTALVHEAYLRLVDERHLAAGHDQEARSRFLGIAAAAMRRILIEHARGRSAEKRGGGRQRLAIDDQEIALPVQDETLLDVDAALVKLDGINPELSRLAELRLFGGLSVRDLAPVMNVSLTTAKANWALARAWLGKLLQERAGTGPAGA